MPPLPLTWTQVRSTDVPSSSNATLEQWDAVIYLPEDRILVCSDCRVAVPSQSLRRHLKSHHLCVPVQRRREIEARLSKLSAAESWNDLSVRPDDSSPLSCLRDPFLGFCCPHCPQVKTTSQHCIRRHRSTHHSAPKTSFDIGAARCFLQAWTNRRDLVQYWKVDVGQRPAEAVSVSATTGPARPERPRLLLPRPIGGEPPPEEFSDILAAEADEEERLLAQYDDTPALTPELEQDDNTDWLRACEWPKWFAHHSLALIVAAARLPAQPASDYVLGHWRGLDCVSAATDERILAHMVPATNVVFTRCEATLQATPRTSRCWLKSWADRYLPYPFEMVRREATRRRYHRYFQQFLCYVFRVWRLGRQLQQSTAKLTGLHLRPLQSEMMRHVWHAFSLRATQETEPSPEPSSLTENLFQLMMMFWTDLSADGNFSHNGIVHFSGVLGIHPSELAYRTAYDYTPFLSALIWVGRLMMLEYCLPLHTYHHLAHPWPGRQHYPDQSQRLQQIRTKYLV